MPPGAPRRVYAIAFTGDHQTTVGLLRDAVTEETIWQSELTYADYEAHLLLRQASGLGIWQSDLTSLDYEAVAFGLCVAHARRHGWVLVPGPNDR